ncbi:hypothetical protein Csa_019432 [Cucumis sativus]|uniref:Uncharacterized protein n=1 Tax=Cucumis sativus TaxID=3659 RepID=A0A0A0LKS2_CUCSA|nr:hypothetical protein Csa_019432 [Cucumis sativus]
MQVLVDSHNIQVQQLKVTNLSLRTQRKTGAAAVKPRAEPNKCSTNAVECDNANLPWSCSCSGMVEWEYLAGSSPLISWFINFITL